jgi:ferredoxin
MAESFASPATLRILPAGWCVPLPAGASLLEAAQRAGIALPRSCRNGTCRACLCQRVAGHTRHRIDWPGLSAEEQQAGWILPCVAEAQGPGEVVIEQARARSLG